MSTPTFKYTARVHFSARHQLGTKFYEIVSVKNNETGFVYVMGLYGPVAKQSTTLGKISGQANRKVYGLEKTVDALMKEKEKNKYEASREPWIIADANTEAEMIVLLKRAGLDLKTPSEQKGMGLINAGGVMSIMDAMAKASDPAFEKQMTAARSAIATTVEENPFAGMW